MNNKSGIYQIKNIINNKIYIGSSISISQRWNTHRCKLRDGSHANSYLQNAWNKYREKNFEFKILEIVKSIDKVLQREQWYLDNCNPDYNLAKCANASMSGRKLSEKTKKILSERRSGENHPMWGKHHSSETKKKISKALSGEKGSFWGKKHTKETKKKISNSQKGTNHYNYGKKASYETKKKMSLSRTGNNNSNSKVNNKIVKEIRKKMMTGKHTLAELGEIWGIHRTTVGNIVNFHTWTNIE